MTNTFTAWIAKTLCALIALATAIAAMVGAWYAFTPAVLGDTDQGQMPFVLLAFAATFISVPVLARWVNDRTLWVVSQLLKR